MPTYTLEAILSKVFSATGYPAMQILGTEEVPSPSEMKMLGKMSIPQANIDYWLDQLAEQHQAVIGSTESDAVLSPAQKEEVDKICTTHMMLSALKGDLIKEQFPEGADPMIFSAMVILPDWQVAGVYLTEEDKRQQEFERKLLDQIKGFFGD